MLQVCRVNLGVKPWLDPEHFGERYPRPNTQESPETKRVLIYVHGLHRGVRNVDVVAIDIHHVVFPAFDNEIRLQHLRVAHRGGSLYEDIPSALPAALRHDWYPNIPRDYLAHTVEIEPGSRLAEILGTRKLRTNSLHHQAIRQPAPGLEVVARAEDDVIEAVELPGKRFAIGVQWHPECLPEEPAMQRLFSEFVNAALE